MAAACAGPRTGPNLGAASSYPGLSCVPFARELSGIDLYGDAASWWDQASGRYARRYAPVTGAVLVFRREARVPTGHVAVVSRLLTSREIHVIEANWVPGEVDEDQLVVDVSARNDWSAVRVWYPPADTLGAHTYPTYGFILPLAPVTHDELARETSRAAERGLGERG